MESKYYVYKHTFPNGKTYIGITSRPDPEDRWQYGYGYKSQRVMYRAIQKYGWDNIEHTILHSGVSEKSAKSLERYYITEVYHSNDREFGYNQTCGGDGIFGYHHSDSTKERLSQKSLAMWSDGKFREEMSKKHSGKNNGNYGKPLSDDQRQILSEYAKTRTGSKNPFYGKSHTSESKIKISNSRKGKHCGTENHNSKRVECIDTGKIFDSASLAAKSLGRNNPSNITSVCRGKSNTAYGLHWRYI